MTRIKLAADAREAVGTTQLRDESIWDGTVRFASTGTSQELPDDVAAQFVDQYEHLVPYEDEDRDDTTADGDT